MTTTELGMFEAGDVTLLSGRVFPSMRLSYKTFGTLNAARDNLVVYPTSFSARHSDTQWLVAEDGVLDPSRWFVVIPDLFGNGLSSSPSNTDFGDDGYPLVAYEDAVAVQRRLMQDVFGDSRIALVYGWSMGGMQAYHWAANHADMVERIAVVCGSAKCSPYNHVFLEGVKAALTANPAAPEKGLRAMGRVYAGWAMSEGFFREELWRGEGFTSLEDYLSRAWEGAYVHRHPADLLAHVATWQAGDISRSAKFVGDLDKAFAAITAKVLLMPGATDRYFQAQDNAAELSRLVNARSVEFKPIPSQHGHRAGNPRDIPADRVFLRDAIRAFLGD